MIGPYKHWDCEMFAGTLRCLVKDQLPDPEMLGLPLATSSHKTFRIKRLLAKKQMQNHPIPQWIRVKIGNKIRYSSKRRRWRRTKLGL
ncbi:large ribosomal subunit protein eL39-like [Camelus bactrianus]|uniref:Large ribosomal subunit protein eL39 n=1 Tax=Camelus bactrianus TaxID=9837 RepID=A0A9W3GAP8_CAMBA|nr:60S ribosomal protein L39-like [Camelus bactrianus]